MESKFGFLRCTEVQKTLFTVQQLCGDASMWWANYTATCPVDYQVSWAEFRDAFHAHYIPAGVMRKKRQEFMDLKQEGRYVNDYSKQFNHLAQYTPYQVDTDGKKKDRFMIGLSTKLQELMALNTGGTFLEFVSNVMIADDAIYTHKETKKRKALDAPSGSAPPKYVWCTTPAPPTHLASHNGINTSVSSSSGLPAHLSTSSSEQHLRLSIHLRM
jgi:hypothetical protein